MFLGLHPPVLQDLKIGSSLRTTGNFMPPPLPGKSRAIPPPTPIRFPQLYPQSTGETNQKAIPLVKNLQSVHRPVDIKLSHFEALNLHVIPDATASDVIPWTGYLPPVAEWDAIDEDDLPQANESTRKPLNNNNLSPGVQTYRERRKELLTNNTPAFRSIRRIPPPAGEATARLGNAYEFFKNLEIFSGFWPDTSLPDPESLSLETDKTGPQPPAHLRTHVRVGSGTQIPPDCRQHLVSAFVKLVTYDFGCNASFARSEPRLHLTPPPSDAFPSSHFNSSASFVFRTPSDRSLARVGIMEGPVAVISARATTGFSTPAEESLDLAREVVAILLTAQHRARDGKAEKLFGEGKWWTSKPRWGGGPGGPIGRENDDKVEGDLPETVTSLPTAEKGASGSSMVAEEAKRAIGGINGVSPNKRSKKKQSTSGNMQIYENYRRLNPPAPTWDRKCRYSAIGKSAGASFDDIFLISSLNHHISIVRARVPDKLIQALEGEQESEEDWGKLEVWRTKWFDLYMAEERVEAMGIVWGMMAWLMRKVDVTE